MKYSKTLFFLTAIVSLTSCTKTQLDILPLGGDFTLVSYENQNWNLKQNAKTINLIFFGYTTCPDYCPNTLSKFKKLNQSLGKTAEEVQYIFISVDPKRDTPEILKKYIEFYISNGIGLTGSKEEIDKIVHNYKANYEVNGNFIDHSTYVYLVDKNVQTRYLFKHKDTIDLMKQIILYLVENSK